MTRPLLAVVAALILPAVAAGQNALDGPAIEVLLEDARERWKIPGIAVAIVQQDEAVYLKGHGVRELGKDASVTPDTAFALASLTKAMAATTLGILVDDRKADWDDPVRKHLPAFRLSDALADREVRLRDLLCHRTGLVRHDLLWYRAPWSLDETVKRLAFLEPAHSFRARYDYCNLGYIAAGQAIGQAAGTSWEAFTRKRLLEPLGMKHAVFTRKEALALADHATPHKRIAGKVTPIEWYPDEQQVRASGSIKASAREMVNWVRMNLNGGRVDGKRLLAAETLAEIHSAQIVSPVEEGFAKLAGTVQQSYGLGWRILDYRGARLVEHNGAADGFRSRLALLPGKKAGFVLFINNEESDAVQALGNLLLDELLGVAKKDWHDFYLKHRATRVARQANQRKDLLAARKKGTKPSRELSAYAAGYSDRAYGDATVKHEEGKDLTLRWSGFTETLEPYHYDTFLVRSTTRLDGELVRFELGRDGNVRTMHLLGRKFDRAK